MRDIPSPAALRVLAQDVADPADGVDDPRLALRLELAAQVADVDLQDVGVAADVVVPNPPPPSGVAEGVRPCRGCSRNRPSRSNPCGGGEMFRPPRHTSWVERSMRRS